MSTATSIKPSPEMVVEQIAGLERIRDVGQVPEFSVFGDDNYAAIDAQIIVLRDGHDAVKACGFCTDDADNEYVTGCAQQAQDWRDGLTDETPVSGWE
jgi:hypothetical protein